MYLYLAKDVFKNQSKHPGHLNCITSNGVVCVGGQLPKNLTLRDVVPDVHARLLWGHQRKHTDLA